MGQTDPYQNALWKSRPKSPTMLVVDLRNKKILLVGLGILGGGEALAKFLLAQKPKLTITDLRSREILSPVIKRLGNKKIKFVLGKHRDVDFKKNDIIVFNPAVSIFSRWAKLAKRYKKPAENDLTLFLKLLKTENSSANYIAITGTRGKTTTSLWINHFLEKSVLGGNIPNRGYHEFIQRPFESLRQLQKIFRAKSKNLS